jgi:dienelactone hydrolase
MRASRLLLLVVASGCGDDATSLPDAGPMADAGPAEDAGPPPSPAIAFFAGGPGEERAVSRLRYGDAFTVRVTGLVAGEQATVRASVWGYRSEAVFEADAEGTLDLARDAPISGSYQGVDRDGPVWSMVRESDDVGRTFGVDFAVEREGAVVAEATLDRPPLDLELDREVVSEDGLVAVLYTPEGPGPHPAVVVFGGSEGGIDSAEFNAARFGALGYAALAVAYFGLPGLPDTLTDVPLEYFDRALDWLAARPGIDGERIALSGGSRGGELVLMIAARRPDVRAVIAEVPSGVRWGSAGLEGRAAWTVGGEPLPYLDAPPDAEAAREMLPGGGTGYRFTPIFEAALATATAAELEAAAIPVEDAEAAILLLGGADDGLWPSCALAGIAMERLEASGHAAEHGDELLCFEETGHFIGMPGWATTESYAFPDDRFGAWLVMGGTAAGTAHAQRVADDRIRAFLDEHLR